MGSKARVYGEENLPKEGGFIIACTHTGYVDILNLGVAMYPVKFTLWRRSNYLK